MAQPYVLYQDQRKCGTGLIYARAVHPRPVGIKEIQERIQHNTSYTPADVRGVLEALVPVMRRHIQNGDKVRLDGIGIIFVGVVSRGAVSEDMMNLNKQIKSYHVNFCEELKSVAGQRTRAVASGIKFVKATGYAPSE